jgi:putative transposase
LSKVIQAYKAAVTHWCRDNGHPQFAWQARFYDEIIRDEVALEHIRQYIVNNPAKWALDKNQSKDVWR